MSGLYIEKYPVYLCILYQDYLDNWDIKTTQHYDYSSDKKHIEIQYCIDYNNSSSRAKILE